MAEADAALNVPIAHIAHRAGKRTRVRIPELRYKGAVLGTIAKQIREHPGVISVDFVELTCSLIIIHEVEPKAVFKFAKDLGLFDLAKGHHRSAHRKAIHFDQNLQAMMFGGLAVLSFAQFVVARSYLSVVSLALAAAGLTASLDARHHSGSLQRLQPYESGSAADATPADA